VVDPGVGTERLALALAAGEFTFVGPDNGALSAALPDRVREAASRTPSAVAVPEDVQAYALSNSRYHRRPVSPTFHARDIFGPVAARLSLNVDISELGTVVGEVIALPPIRADRAADGSLVGRVVHVDRFGNVITTVQADQLPSQAEVSIAGRMLTTHVRAYAEAARLTTLIGSCGYLEIAKNGGSAQDELGVAVGDPVVVRPA
jgi:S-adenosyl-L-methionine hydrolase (adenosine-forming)